MTLHGDDSRVEPSMSRRRTPVFSKSQVISVLEQVEFFSNLWVRILSGFEPMKTQLVFIQVMKVTYGAKIEAGTLTNIKESARELQD